MSASAINAWKFLIPFMNNIPPYNFLLPLGAEARAKYG